MEAASGPSDQHPYEAVWVQCLAQGHNGRLGAERHREGFEPPALRSLDCPLYLLSHKIMHNELLTLKCAKAPTVTVRK